MSSYLSNKYTKIYYEIINRAQSRDKIDGYTETHHIIPRSLGGSDCKDNLVILTAREHFLCHRLLTKMTTGKEKSKMVFAMWAFTRSSRNQSRQIINSHIYSHIREEWAKEISKLNSNVPRRNLTEDEKRKMSLVRKGIPKSEETKKRMREAWKTRSKEFSLDHRKKITEANIGRTASEETRQKMSKVRSGINPVWTQKTFVCEHCGKTGTGISNYNRWHGDNCKHKEIT
jgi:hypothetical protein